MTVRLVEQRRGCLDSEIATLIRLIGHVLPGDYQEFLLKTNGATPEPNRLPLSHGDTLGVVNLLSLGEIVDDKQVLRGRLRADTWPIADAEGGNYVCLHLDRGSWSVTFWDHEVEREYPIAESFADFMKALQPAKVGGLLRPGQVESVWVDPTLLDEID